MFGLSFWEIAMVMVVALLVLGPERLPSVLRSVGKGMRELRKASSGLRSALEEPLEEIRQPLDEIRDQVMGEVNKASRGLEAEARRIEQHVERELDTEQPPPPPLSEIAPGSDSPQVLNQSSDGPQLDTNSRDELPPNIPKQK